MSEATVDVADLRPDGDATPDGTGGRRPAARRHPASGARPRRGDRGAGRRRRPGPGRVDPRRGVRDPPLRGGPRRSWRSGSPRSTSASANHVIRAFSHFSLLANLAEDIHHERRRRFHRREGSPPQTGSLAATFAAGSTSADLDAGRRGPRAGRRAGVPGGDRAPDRGPPQDDLAGPAAGDRAGPAARPVGAGRARRARSGPRQLWRAVLTLWQTALLRLSRLRLSDEIDEALRYYELSLFEVVPAINAELRRALAEPLAGRRAAAAADAPARLVDRRRPRRQPVRHRRRRSAGPPPGRPRRRSDHHLAELSALRRRAVDVRPAGHADARAVRPGRRRAGTTPRSAPTSPTAAR